MDYLKMIEFLSQELIRKDDAINSLRNDVDHQKSIIDKLTKLNDKYKDAWSTEFAYHHLKKAYEDNNSYYEERIAKLQVEINHLKNNN